MTIAIVGSAVVTALGEVNVYQLTSDPATDKLIKPTREQIPIVQGDADYDPLNPGQFRVGQINNPFTWYGDNCFELLVGEYYKDWVDPLDHSKGYNGFLLRLPQDFSKVSMIVDEDLHHATNTFSISCTYVTEGPTYSSNPKDVIPGETRLEGQIAMTVPPATPDYKLAMSKPKFTPDGSEKPRPGKFSILAKDTPRSTSIETPFVSTYPVADYDHYITYSGDSSYFWDHGHVDHGTLLTPDTTNKSFKRSLTVNEWAGQALFTGYLTVSVEGWVQHKTTKAKVAATGYNLYIEYFEGQATGFRYLKDGATEKFFVNDECQKLAVPSYT